MSVSRRAFLKGGLVAGAGLTVLPRFGGVSAFAQVVQVPLPGRSIPQFVDPLPLLDLQGGPMETVLGDAATLTMAEFRANVMPSTFQPGSYEGTWVWGYRTGTPPTAPAGTYIGPVIVAQRGVPTAVTYVNALGDTHTSRLDAWVNATDQTLHWADPLGTGHSMEHYAGPVPAVPHLHGGEVPPVLDGGPDSWWTSDGGYRGHAFYTREGAPPHAAIYRYPNTQEAAPLWFHDHVLGATRLNVYAGLAGAYAVIDPDMPLPAGLHPVGLQRGDDVDYLVPLVIQDRMFDTAGQLFFPNIGLNPEHPYWLPEFEGDTIVVNGKVWPYLDVEPRRYRFLFLNGSNARAYEMFLTNPVTNVDGPAMWQIASDGGYLNGPVKIDPAAPNGQLQRLLILPGERADVIIDFAGLQGQTLTLRNLARHPFPRGVTPHGRTLGRIMQFRVGPEAAPADTSFDPSKGDTIRGGSGQATAIVALTNPAMGTLNVSPDKTRLLTLNEVLGAGGPLMALVNNSLWDGKRPDGTTRSDFVPVTVGGHTEYFSELPEEGTTELWEVVNLTADAHPIHTHLTQVQLVNRQNFNVNRYTRTYDGSFPAGVYVGGDGPPLGYAPSPASGDKYGGNPDVAPYLQGPARPPDANEAGWKDTVTMYPGQVTRIAVRYAPTDKAVGDPDLVYPFDPDAKVHEEDDGHGYVWHCHIVDHEDNEMMRPLRVSPDPDAEREYVQGIDY
jgi:spore coat protein A, manganese oxidase